MKPTLLVLAAGIGSRYGGVKQIDPVGPCNEILVDYAVYDAVQAGFGKVVFVVGPAIAAEFRSEIACKYEGKIAVDFAVQRLNDLPAGFTVPPEREKPWGTGHAILCARRHIREPFVVINADDFYGRSSYEKLAGALTGANRGQNAGGDIEEYCMCGFHLQNTLSAYGSVSRGICAVDDKGYLLDVKEITAIEKCDSGAKYKDQSGQDAYLEGNEIVSMNMWGFTPSVFGYLEDYFRVFLRERRNEPKSEFFIPEVVSKLITTEKSRVRVLVSKEKWFGVTYKEDKARVVQRLNELVAAGVYPSPLFTAA